MIGKTLSHFKITAKLGEGGMGEVYRAEDSKLGREVAIKVLPEAVAGDSKRLARFEREAKAIAALSHPNIVTVHSIESIEEVHFITMELVEGQTLSELLPRGGCSLVGCWRSPSRSPMRSAAPTARESRIATSSRTTSW